MSQQRGYLPVYMVHREQIVDLYNCSDGRSWRWMSTSPFAAFLGSPIAYQLSNISHAPRAQLPRGRTIVYVLYARKLRA